MDGSLLASLRCPLNGMPLRAASEQELRELAPDWSAGLIREDGERLYPVEAGIPLLVPDAGRPPER